MEKPAWPGPYTNSLSGTIWNGVPMSGTQLAGMLSGWSGCSVAVAGKVMPGLAVWMASGVVLKCAASAGRVSPDWVR